MKANARIDASIPKKPILLHIEAHLPFDSLRAFGKQVALRFLPCNAPESEVQGNFRYVNFDQPHR